jgi:hypothetical protein
MRFTFVCGLTPSRWAGIKADWLPVFPVEPHNRSTANCLGTTPSLHVYQCRTTLFRENLKIFSKPRQLGKNYLHRAKITRISGKNYIRIGSRARLCPRFTAHFRCFSGAGLTGMKFFPGRKRFAVEIALSKAAAFSPTKSVISKEISRSHSAIDPAVWLPG